MAGKEDLPRGWMMAGLHMASAGDLKKYIREAAVWGFADPGNLTNNAKMRNWLQERRGEAWDMLQDDTFPAKQRRQPKRRHRSVNADLCQVSASEVNEFLRSLPQMEATERKPR